jgi:hypothetical protein
MGCTNYKAIDLSGLGELQSIAASAYQTITINSINFDGCLKLETLGMYAFSPITNVTGLDMSNTGIKEIMDRCFGTSTRLEWIEYPPTLIGIGSYQFSNPYNLRYVRYRSLIQPDWAWCVYNYHNNTNTSSTAVPSPNVPTHSHEGIDQAYSNNIDHMFVLYHPNTSAWTKPHTGFNFSDDDGYYFTSQNVPLGSPIGEDVTLATVNTTLTNDTAFHNALRGDALLTAQESYRGLPSITISASGLTATSVTVNATGASQSISGGVLNLTINTPTSGLQTLTPAKAAELITIATTDPRNRHPFSLTASDTWTVGANTGNYAEPWVTHPADPTEFLVLDLALNDGKKLVGYFENAKIKGDTGIIINDTRTVNYIYVDKDVVLHRTMRADGARKEYLRTVALTLKAGWNLVETVEQDDSATVISTSIWISGGITHGQDDTSQITRDRYTYRTIPWVAK